MHLAIRWCVCVCVYTYAYCVHYLKSHRGWISKRVHTMDSVDFSDSFCSFRYFAAISVLQILSTHFSAEISTISIIMTVRCILKRFQVHHRDLLLSSSQSHLPLRLSSESINIYWSSITCKYSKKASLINRFFQVQVGSLHINEHSPRETKKVHLNHKRAPDWWSLLPVSLSPWLHWRQLQIIKMRITILTFVPSTLHILLNLNPHQQAYDISVISLIL